MDLIDKIKRAQNDWLPFGYFCAKWTEMAKMGMRNNIGNEFLEINWIFLEINGIFWRKMEIIWIFWLRIVNLIHFSQKNEFSIENHFQIKYISSQIIRWHSNNKKWRLSLFNWCVEMSIYLMSSCPFHAKILSVKIKTNAEPHLTKLWHCVGCY